MSAATFRANGDANSYTILQGDRWLANVLINGELTVPQQEVVMQGMAGSLAPPAGGAITNAALYLRAYTGKLIRVDAMFPVADLQGPMSAEPANAYMEQTPGVGLLAICNGIALLAKVEDLGQSPEKVERNRLADGTALLRELVDLEGPQPGNAAWARKVHAFLDSMESEA